MIGLLLLLAVHVGSAPTAGQASAPLPPPPATPRATLVRTAVLTTTLCDALLQRRTHAVAGRDLPFSALSESTLAIDTTAAEALITRIASHSVAADAGPAERELARSLSTVLCTTHEYAHTLQLQHYGSAFTRDAARTRLIESQADLLAGLLLPIVARGIGLLGDSLMSDAIAEYAIHLIRAQTLFSVFAFDDFEEDRNVTIRVLRHGVIANVLTQIAAHVGSGWLWNPYAYPDGTSRRWAMEKGVWIGCLLSRVMAAADTALAATVERETLRLVEGADSLLLAGKSDPLSWSMALASAIAPASDPRALSVTHADLLQEGDEVAADGGIGTFVASMLEVLSQGTVDLRKLGAVPLETVGKDSAATEFYLVARRGWECKIFGVDSVQNAAVCTGRSGTSRSEAVRTFQRLVAEIDSLGTLARGVSPRTDWAVDPRWSGIEPLDVAEWAGTTPAGSGGRSSVRLTVGRILGELVPCARAKQRCFGWELVVTCERFGPAGRSGGGKAPGRRP